MKAADLPRSKVVPIVQAAADLTAALGAAFLAELTPTERTERNGGAPADILGGRLRVDPSSLGAVLEDPDALLLWCQEQWPEAVDIVSRTLDGVTETFARVAPEVIADVLAAACDSGDPLPGIRVYRRPARVVVEVSSAAHAIAAQAGAP